MPHHDNIMTPRHHDIAMSSHQSAATLRSQNGEIGNGRAESRDRNTRSEANSVIRTLITAGKAGSTVSAWSQEQTH